MLAASSLPAVAATAAISADAEVNFHLTSQPVGWLVLVLFVLAYIAVIAEERIQIAKSKPVMLAAGLIWGALAWWTNVPGQAE